MQIVFWFSVLAIATTYFLYPICLLLIPRRRAIRVVDEMPPVTLIISAYNEEGVIREKLENALALDYPRDRLEIMVISDDSEDRTDDIVRSYSHQGVRLYRQTSRQGKSSGLTRFVPKAGGDILVFSDANSMYDSQAIRKLVRHFADAGVGFVVGHQRYVQEQSAASTSESLYWRYETWLKIHESRVGSVVCGDGAIYAIRSPLFVPLRDDDINDFTIPLQIIARGYRGVFDKEAICYERTAENFHGEFRRKVRIVNRSFRAVLRVRQVLNPFRVGAFAFQVGIHKVLRWFVPFFLGVALLSNVYLSAYGHPFYIASLAVQIGLYVMAGLYLIPGLRQFKPIYVAYYFCLVNLAAGLGVLGTLTGKRITTWNPERSPSHGTPATTGQ